MKMMTKGFVLASAALLMSPGLTTAGDSETITVEEMIADRQSIETLERDVQRMKLQLEMKELEFKLANAGKEKSEDDRDTRDSLFNPYQDALAVSPEVDIEQQRQQRLDSVFDDAVVGSVFRDEKNSMRAILVTPSGKLPLREQQKIGNWTVEVIELDGVVVKHSETGDTRIIPTASEAAQL